MGAGTLARNWRDRYTGNGISRSFGIAYAKERADRTPRGSGIEKHGKDDIQLSIQTNEGKDIVFQFKLVRNEMSIRAYDPNVPTSAKIQVPVNNASVDAVMNDPKSTITEKQNALRIRDMMSRTKSGVKESSLNGIAQQLVRDKYSNKKKKIIRR